MHPSKRMTFSRNVMVSLVTGVDYFYDSNLFMGFLIKKIVDDIYSRNFIVTQIIVCFTFLQSWFILEKVL